MHSLYIDSYAGFVYNDPEVIYMEILQLTYFCASAEAENFSKTAKKFNVPASNISQSVHRLEEELGTKLFDRSANRITLNSCGKMFYEDIKKALTLIENAKFKVRETDEINGEIRILALTNRRIVTTAVELFEKKYPSVSFFINHFDDENLDDYDIIITDKLLSDRRFSKKLLVEEDILLAVAKSNQLANKDFTVQDLENERFISMSEKSGIYKLTQQICSSAGFVPNIVIQSDDPYYIRKYIEMGMGVSFIPSISWKGLFSDNVICKKITDTKRITHVYNNAQKYISRACESFMSELFEIGKNN